MKNIAAVILFLFTAIATQAQTKWQVDPYHSKVNFSVGHLVISEVDGTFKVFSRSISTDKEDFEGAKINFEIDATSINTDNDQRDGHLKSEDFFYVEKHPKITFASTSFKKAGKGKYKLKGKLTMRGVTKEVELDVKYGGMIANDGYGNTKAGFIVSGMINRMDYGIAWNTKTEHGGLTVGEEVDIKVKLEFAKQ